MAFDQWYDSQIIAVVDAMIRIDVTNGYPSLEIDTAAAEEKMRDLGIQDSLATVLVGIDAFGSVKTQNYIDLMKTAILGKKSDNYRGAETGTGLKDNVELIGSVIKICKTAWNFGKSMVYIAHDMIELSQIGQGKELYDTYGCALIDSFGQRLSMRSKGEEILTGATDETFASWDDQKKESQRRALICLLNLDEYIVITYKNMKTINADSGFSFNRDYEWSADEEIESALNTIRNIRSAIRNIPEEARLYDK